jgi:tRNA dimethylallyltransferase
MQVYRGMDVGTAKPAAELRRRLTHHLVDVAEPGEQFTAGRFVKEAESLIPGITARGKVPVVSGGTAFYVTNLLFGLPEAPPVDTAMRARLREDAEREGQAAMFAALAARDPEAAARIQPNDRYRTLRALEVLESTGRSLFSFRWPRETREDLRFLVLGLDRPRDELYRRIGMRVAAMFEDGLLDEVESLLARGFGPGDPGLRGIGYREILEMRDGCETLPLVRERIAQDTRRYAKRQLTFFRSVPGVTWVDPSSAGEIMTRIESFSRSP